eukprot:4515159-Amphidinium_carterae.1
MLEVSRMNLAMPMCGTAQVTPTATLDQGPQHIQRLQTSAYDISLMCKWYSPKQKCYGRSNIGCQLQFFNVFSGDQARSQVLPMWFSSQQTSLQTE